MVGVVIAGFRFFLTYKLFSLISLSFTFLLLIFFRFLTINFLNTFLKTNIIFKRDYLERKTQKSSEKYLYKNIRKIWIKWTFKGTIRELKIILNDGKDFTFNGLENFLEFKNELTKKCNNQIEIEEVHEPIDYDHPLFYVVFGFFVGFISIFLIAFIGNLDVSKVKVIYNLISVYVVIMGIYFLINKPLLKHYGNKSDRLDNISGIIMFIAAVIVYMLGRIN
jgi:hypothetical protein